MDQAVKVAVIFYSSTGSVYRLARAAAEAATAAGAEVRVRKVRELAPAEAIASNPAWAANARDTAGVPEATLDDLDWGDVILLGTPTRYGGAASQLRQFIDTTGPLWRTGRLAGKVYSAFTSAATAHGGHETTLMSLTTLFHHWGGVIVPPGYTDPVQFRSGTPYGTSHLDNGAPPTDTTLAAVAYQAQRAIDVAAALKAGRSSATGA